MNLSRWPRPLVAAALLLLMTLGCGKSVNTDAMIAAQNDTNIKRLSTLYSFFQLQNDLKGPKDEAEFRQFISNQDAERLARAKISVGSLDDLFKSERDGQAFKIRFGINTVVRGPSYGVIFEAEGVDGLRQVGFTNGPVQEVDASEYDALWSGKRDKDTQVQDNRKG